MKQLSVRFRLLLALGLLAFAVLSVGAIAWVALSQSKDRLDRLHEETLAEVTGALSRARQAADLATVAPYLLTLDSPFRIAQEGQTASGLVKGLRNGLAPDSPLNPILDDLSDSIAALVRDISLRAGLRDRTLRISAELAAAERRFAALSARNSASFDERQDWLALQGVSAALLGAGRAENLIGVGEYQRAYTRLMSQLLRQTGNSFPGQASGSYADELARLQTISEGRAGLFELRRLELARQIGAEAALVRIRQGAATVSAQAAATTAQAQAVIAAERDKTATAIAVAKSTLLTVVVASAVLALTAALYVSGYVIANLHAISDAMIRLAAGDRQTRLPRGEGKGDEIGKLFRAFRFFRANALRLDRSHRQMAQRTALYENMMSGMNDGVAILSEQGQIVAQNDRLAPLLRVEAVRLAQRPKLSEILSSDCWQVSKGPSGLSTLSLPSGNIVEMRESPLPQGGAVVLFADATERRQMEERLNQIQRIEALGKVSGEVAHDFGNILSTISGSLHLLENAPPNRQAALIQAIASAVDLGTALTGRLLAFARRQHLEPEIVDLPALVEGIADLVGFALHDGIQLAIEVGSDPLPVRVDPGQLESAILNLCLNSGNAIEGTGQITLAVRREGDLALIEVKDTGAGMTPDVLAHAMEPFFTARADGTGTGLGLAMVYGFIRQSGGDIHIESAPRMGTTVRLFLPLQQEAIAIVRIPGKVLIVEDNASEREAAIALLSPLTDNLVSTSDVSEAMRHLSNPVSLIVTDLSLHGRIEGWRLAETSLAQWPAARAIVVSGRLPDVDPLSGRFADRVTTLSKPLTAKALSNALWHLFRTSEANASTAYQQPQDFSAPITTGNSVRL